MTVIDTVTPAQLAVLAPSIKKLWKFSADGICPVSDETLSSWVRTGQLCVAICKSSRLPKGSALELLERSVAEGTLHPSVHVVGSYRHFASSDPERVEELLRELETPLALRSDAPAPAESYELGRYCPSTRTLVETSWKTSLPAVRPGQDFVSYGGTYYTHPDFRGNGLGRIMGRSKLLALSDAILDTVSRGNRLIFAAKVHDDADDGWGVAKRHMRDFSIAYKGVGLGTLSPIQVANWKTRSKVYDVDKGVFMMCIDPQIEKRVSPLYLRGLRMTLRIVRRRRSRTHWVSTSARTAGRGE